MTGFRIILTIVILNSLIALVVFTTAFFQNGDKKSTLFMLSWFIFIVPSFGILYILMGRIFVFLNRKKPVDMRDISFSREREAQILPPDLGTEMNYAPISDAMAVSDTSSLRELLLSVLRDDAIKSASAVSGAVESKDTETSHYAASFILDALSEYRSTVQTMIAEVEEHPENADINLLALGYIHGVLSSGILNNMEQKSYIYIMDDMAENLFIHNLWNMTATHYLWMVDLFIFIKDYNMANKWVKRAKLYRPNLLDTYKAQLRLFFGQKRWTEFFDCLNEIKESDITVDSEILNLFRLYI